MEDKEKYLKRRQRTKRVIAKRISIIKNEWRTNYMGFEEEHPWEHMPGRVDKHNLRCGCRTCRIKERHPYKQKKAWQKLKENLK